MMSTLRYSNIVKILAYLGANKNYNYVDRIANALDSSSVYEALKDSMRAYLSECVGGMEKAEEKREIEEERKVTLEQTTLEEEKQVGKITLECPDISPEELDREVNNLIRELENLSGGELFKFTRQLALEVYATIPRMVKSSLKSKEHAQSSK
jgi:CRISPR type I-A-associated protein Csa5